MNEQSVPPPPQQTEGSNNKVLKVVGCSCLGILLLAVLGFGGCVYSFSKVFKQNEPYIKGVEAVMASAEAKEALGEPISPGFIPSGNVSTNNGEGEADWNISVSGPKGKGSVKVVAKKSGGVWNYEVLELTVEGTGQKIPLTIP